MRKYKVKFHISMYSTEIQAAKPQRLASHFILICFLVVQQLNKWPCELCSWIIIKKSGVHKNFWTLLTCDITWRKLILRNFLWLQLTKFLPHTWCLHCCVFVVVTFGCDKWKIIIRITIPNCYYNDLQVYPNSRCWDMTMIEQYTHIWRRFGNRCI